jgi:pilus assembly protein CpaE
MPDIAESANSNALAVVLIVPDLTRRLALAAALTHLRLLIARELDDYPSQAEVPDIAALALDVVIVDLDSDVDRAIEAITEICNRNPAMTVMAYSSKNDSTMMRRSMQAGVREFLIEPLLPGMISEAFARAFVRRRDQRKAPGKLLVFAPSKGGVGVTTIATNFALALAKENAGKVVILDMNFQLGEIALGLGVRGAFSVVDALMNALRLDREFLATLLIKHSSGLSVLTSPEDFSFFNSPLEGGVDKLLQILRDEFDYIVVDSGTCHGIIQERLFDLADKLYLVTEMSFPALRNAHRLISFLTGRPCNGALEVVLNRFNSRHPSIDENSAVKALARPIAWRIPNDFVSARAAENSGIPMGMADSPITRALTLMARFTCGKPSIPEKKAAKGFSFFGSKALSQVTDL